MARAGVLALVVLACGCAHRARRGRPLEGDVDAVLLPSASGDKSRPPGEDPSRRVAAGRVDFHLLGLRGPRAVHQRLGAESLDEPPMGRGVESLQRASDVLKRPPPADAKPDAGDPKGRPAARRPDETEATATTGQPRYFSPKPLARKELAHDIPSPLTGEAPAGAAEVEARTDAKRADFAPPDASPIADEVPETAVEDPKALGSYHVQVSTDPSFAAVIFNRVYPFMADIDLDGDLAARGTRRGVYWVRYSIVDLLEFEHPFTAPQRFVYVPP